MVATMEKPVLSPEGSGEKVIMPKIDEIPAISDRVWRWLLSYWNEKCSKHPSFSYDSCTGCQELQERYGMDAPYSDSEFKKAPHGPQIRSMTEKFIDFTINALREWGMLNSEYSTKCSKVNTPKPKEQKRHLTQVTR